MRKIYSLVLMTAMLLVGTNAWADVHATLVDGVDEAKVTKDGGSTWMYATHLKEAFDYVEMNETAEIVLLNNADLSEPITMPKQIVAADMVGATAKKGQNITLDLGNSNLSISTNVAGVTMFRLVKGTLNITGNGSILKTAAESGSGKYWWGSTAIAVGGTEYKDSADWSVLTIDKNVTISVTGNSGARAIGIANHNGIGTSTYKSDMLYCKETITDLRNKYGYDTRVEKKVWNTALTDNFEHQVDSAIAKDHTDYAVYSERSLPMDCGQITSNKKTILQGAAFGVKVTVAGTISAPEYALHMHGNINQVPGCAGAQTARDMNLPAPYYETQFPYIYIAPTAHIEASASPGNVGLYAAGWAVWDISGEVKGATGVYAKAGDIVLKDAVITSTCATPGQNGNEGDNLSSGVNDAGGSAIVIESSDTYAGATGVTVQGDTKITGNGGYAIFDQTTQTDGTEPTTTHITVEGGTIESGGQGGIMVTDGTVDVTTIVGGNVTPTVEVTNTTTGETTAVPVNNFIPEGTHTTTVEVNGKTTVVISQGAAPTEYDHVYGNAKDSVKWVGTGADATEILADNLTLKELEINQSYAQVLTVPSTKTLTVEHLIMGENAQIIVEAGAKLLVTGTQGIVAPVTSNIVLEASESTQATFLFNPNVTSNRHPNATVQFVSRAYRDNVKLAQYQRFVLPVRSIKVEDITNNWTEGVYGKSGSLPTFTTAIFEWRTDWTRIDNIADYEMKAFTGYNMTNNSATEGVTYTFTGEVVGNDNKDMEFNTTGWYFYGNSYTAPTNTVGLLQGINDDRISKTIYLWDATAHIYRDYSMDDYGTALWNAPAGVPAMQTFIFNQIETGSVVNTINYETMVWDHNVSPAPARVAQNSDITTMRISVSDVNGKYDRVNVKVAERYTSEFDNGGDANKFMNDGHLNIFAATEIGLLSSVATDNAQGTMFTLQTTDETDYMISFSCVSDELYALRDNLTGSVVAIANGNTYCFSAEANQTIEGRFEIVGRQEMPTEVETIENVNMNNGSIYTITGQYVGDANSWFTLPAGMYIVNGQKVVK